MVMQVVYKVKAILDISNSYRDDQEFMEN